MGRPPRFTADGVLDAALEAVASHGTGATVSQVAEVLGTRPASVYYRFPTREHLMASLWVRCVHRFHEVYLRPLNASSDPLDALVAAAVTIPDYCRDHPAEAVGLTLYRHGALLADCPAGLEAEIATLNDAVFATLRDVSASAWPMGRDVALVRSAVQQLPYGLVRPYIGTREPVPAWLSDAVRAAARAMLTLPG